MIKSTGLLGNVGYRMYCRCICLMKKMCEKSIEKQKDKHGLKPQKDTHESCMFTYFSRYHIDTLQGTSISYQKSLLKMIFLFPRWDMLVPWRVSTLLFATTEFCDENPVLNRDLHLPVLWWSLWCRCIQMLPPICIWQQGGPSWFDV